MKKQAIIAAAFIILMFAVATIFVDVVSAQPAHSSEKSSASVQRPASLGEKNLSYDHYYHHHHWHWHWHWWW